MEKLKYVLALDVRIKRTQKMLIAKCHLARIKKYVDISEKPNKHVTTYSCYLFYRQERDETRTPRTLDDIAVFECEN